MSDKKNINSTTLSGKLREYRIELKDGTLHITDTLANRDGTKTLSDGELLNFSDIKGFKIKFTKGSSVDFNFERDGEGVLLYASGDHDTITGYFGNNNVIICGRGNDTISVLGDNTIDGGDGNDTIEVKGNNNSIRGGRGNDIIKCPDYDGNNYNSIDGGDGDDRIEAGSGSLGRINGGAGIDTLKWAIDSKYIAEFIKYGWMKPKDGGVEIVGDTLLNIERLEFNDKTLGLAYSSQNNTPVNGSASDDIILGDDCSNTFSGDHGNDTIYAGAGDDTVNGDDGHDEIYGGEGNDTIDGGEGRDTIHLSGSYSDYRFTRKENGDIVITDKVNNRDGEDTIRNVEHVSFSDLKKVNLVKLSKLVMGDQTGFKVPLPVKDVLDKDKQGSALSRNQGSFTISKNQLLKNDVRNETSDQGYQLIIDPSSVTGGTAILNADGDVEYTPDQHSTALMGFKYSVQDREGNSIRVKELKEEGYEIVENPGPGEQTAVMSARVTFITSDLPKDSLLSEQWYLFASNVLPVWQHYTGKGVRIALFEPDGEAIYNEHVDLKKQLWQTPQRNTHDQKTYEFSDHATLVGGVMVAEKNDQGIVGVAYDATLSGFSNNDTDLNQMQHYDVVNHSWSRFSKSYVDVIDFNDLQSSYKEAISYGRNGLGTIIVQGAGNGRTEGHNTNYYSMSNTRSTITVGAINLQNDVSTLQRSNEPFSTPGANILVSAPGADILSTDFQEKGGTNDYKRASGTSFSAPIVAGVVALILEANPRLGFRDVQAILALTARRDIVEDEKINFRTVWQTNASKAWNGGGMHISHDYGYGQVDALAAVHLAENWMVSPQTEANVRRFAVPVISPTLNRAIPHGQTAGITESLSVEDNDIQIEHVEVRIRLKHGHDGDLIIKLISPSGTESILMDRPGKTNVSGTVVEKNNNNKEITHVFSTARLRGELGRGDWKLEVIDAHDANNEDTATLVDWGVNIYGASYNNDDQYIYTDEYAQLAVQPGRNVVEDSNGGIDTINAAAINRASDINITTGKAILSGQSLTIRQAEAIENLVGGAYDDHLTGNAQCNILVGGRGNDRLSGGAGSDCLFGNQGQNTLTGGDDADFFVIDKHAGNLDTIEDFALGQDRLILSGFADNISNTLSATQEGCDTRVMLGNQSVLLKNIQASQFGKKHTLTISQGLHPNEIPNAAKVYFGHDDGVTEDLSVQTAGKLAWLGSGNDIFTGTQGADMIDGGGGDDIISGGRGDDNLSGGKGNDTYRFSRFDGNDTIRDKDTTPNNQDQILFGEGIASDQLWFSKKGDDLYIQVIGTTDSITINQHYVDESYRIERFQLANGKALSVAKIDALVSAMSAFAPPKAGQMTLPDNYQKELNATIAASWQ